MRSYRALNENSLFGECGGLCISETLISVLQELVEAYKMAEENPSFWEELRHNLKHYIGRLNPVYHAV